MRIAAGGVHEYAGLLVQNDYVVVLMNDVQGNILGQDILARRLRKRQLDNVAGTQLEARLDGFPVDRDGFGLDCPLQEAAAQIAEAPVEILVYPPLLDRMPHVQ